MSKLFTVLLVVFFTINLNAQVVVKALTVEGIADIPGLDKQHPRLSWQITAEGKNIKQTAYQIWVASSEKNLAGGIGDVWNSGMVKSDASINVMYTGDSLMSYKKYYWKVKVWTNKGAPVISENGNWQMGILHANEWTAKWIGRDTFGIGDQPDSNYTRLAARYLRKNETLNKPIKNATAFISGMGLYELYINGNKVGNAVLATTVKEYNKEIPYNTLDVTSYLLQGKNGIGVILGNGRFFTLRNYRGSGDWLTGIPPITNYGYPMLLLQIKVNYTDGSSVIISSDEQWKVTDKGPIIANSEYDGEEYNAGIELGNWSSATYNDASWNPVDIMTPPSTNIQAQLNENIVIKDSLKPVSIHKTLQGTYIVDMGQNMVGWLAINVKGNKGDTVKMVFAETLTNRDSLYLANIRHAKVTDKYILKGGASEQWEPRFSYHGFRYVEISGLSYMPSATDFTGKVIYDNIATTGSFTSSDTMLNHIYQNAYWTIRGNYRGMPTDCPQRDERMGWLGDRSINSYGESFLFDNARIYAKWMHDIAATQKDNGSIADIAPSYWKMYTDNVTWPSSLIIIPEMLRKQFGDSINYAEVYPQMKKWMLFMWDTYGQNNLVLRDNYGDWCLPPETLDIIHSKDSTRNTKGSILAASYYYYCLQLMQQYAHAQGLTADEIQFKTMAEKTKLAFNQMFYHPDSMYYANNTVTSNLLPLTFGLAPENDRKQIFNHIVERTKNMYNSHISTGLVGGQWLMRGLSDNGRPDLAYTIATNTTYPGWGYMIEQGATTVWELWNGNTAEPSMNSGNHVMLLGDLLVWYYEYLAGIKTDETAVAFKKIIMNPYLPEKLNFVNASYKSRYGIIKSHWTKQNNNLVWDITIPPNTSADVYLPATTLSEIFENNKPVTGSKDVKLAGHKDGKYIVSIGSGSYHFTTKIK